MNIKEMIIDFMGLIESGEVEVYNEFSLQHEMGIFFRTRLSDYKVQFERNTKFFNIKNTIKHEIDIVIYTGAEKYAIELKYPKNGQYPETMFSFIKDIKFMEELKKAGFNETYCLSLVSDKNFYSGKRQDGVYSFFRGNTIINGAITKPTGKQDEIIIVDGHYQAQWIPCGGMKYYLIQI